MSTVSPSDQFGAVERTIVELREADASRLAELKVELLGRKNGRLTQILRSLSTLSPEKRPAVGQRANQLKGEIEAAIERREQELSAGAASSEDVDFTMPGRSGWRGAIHPVTAVIDQICEIFRELGFSRVTGPEVETDDYNFTKLNIPLDHPAADMHDTFYLSPGILLRTHTSPVQARTLEQYEPPVRIVVPGRVYRRDPFDASHAPVFLANRRSGGRRRHHVRRVQGGAGLFRQTFLLVGYRSQIPAVVLPVHGTVGRGRRAMPNVQG